MTRACHRNNKPGNAPHARKQSASAIKRSRRLEGSPAGLFPTAKDCNCIGIAVRLQQIRDTTRARWPYPFFSPTNAKRPSPWWSETRTQPFNAKSSCVAIKASWHALTPMPIKRAMTGMKLSMHCNSAMRRNMALATTQVSTPSSTQTALVRV